MKTKLIMLTALSATTLFFSCKKENDTTPGIDYYVPVVIKEIAKLVTDVGDVIHFSPD